MTNEKRPRIDSNITAALIGGFFTLIATVITIIATSRSNDPAPGASVVITTAAPAVTATSTFDFSAAPAASLTPTFTPSLTHDITPSYTSTVTPTPTATHTATEPPTTEAIPIQGATPAPDGWLPVEFVYDAQGFFWLNPSTQRLAARSISFEQIGGSGLAYAGSRWSQFGNTLYPGYCMRLNAFGEQAYASRPGNCIDTNSTVVSNSRETFWLIGQFRVLWNGQAVAVCDSAAGQCATWLPPE